MSPRMVIGRDGQTIRKIQNETGAKVQFNTVDPNAPGERYVLVQGSKEQVDRAVFQVNQICEKAITKESRYVSCTVNRGRGIMVFIDCRGPVYRGFTVC